MYQNNPDDMARMAAAIGMESAAAPIMAANVKGYYTARDNLRDAMEQQHQASRAYVMPDTYTAIDAIVMGYINISDAAALCAEWAAIVETRAREMALWVNDGHTLMDVYAYESARNAAYLASIKRGN